MMRLMTDLKPRTILFLLLLLTLGGASLFFGADTPMTLYLFTSVIFILCGAAMIAFRDHGMPRLFVYSLLILFAFVLFDVMTERLTVALPDYTALVAAAGVFFVAALMGRTTAKPHIWWQAIVVIFALIAGWAFVDFIINPETIHGMQRPYHEDRLSAAFLSANTAATFFGIGFLASTMMILKALTHVGRVQIVTLVEALFRHAFIALFGFIFSGICLFLTASRAGIVFTFVSLGVLVVWEILAARRKAVAQAALGRVTLILSAVGIVLIIGVLFWTVSGDVAGARYAELEGDANMRLVMFAAYWEAASLQSLWGYGLGSFDDVNNAIMTPQNAHILASQGAAHNVLLQWLLQVGWMGSVAMWGIIAFIFIRIRHGLQEKRQHVAYLRAVIVISVFILLHGLVDYALEIPGVMWWWALLLGFAYGIASGRVQKDPKRRSALW